MKHDIQAYWLPSTATTTAISVGNTEVVSDGEGHDVEVANYTIADAITYYQDNGIGHYFMCAECKVESTAREQYSRDVYGVHDVMTIESDRDLDFKEDDIVLLPFGKYRIVATDNSKIRPIKNGFRIHNIGIVITMVKQDE